MGAENRLRLGEPGAEEDLWGIAGDFAPQLKRLLPAEVLVGLGFDLLQQAGIRRQDVRQVKQLSSAIARRPHDLELPGEVLLLALTWHDEDRGVLVANARSAGLDRRRAHQAPFAGLFGNLLR